MPEEIKKRLPVILVGVIFVALLGIFIWKSNIKEDKFDWSTDKNLQLSTEEKAKYEEVVTTLKTDQKNAEALVNLARLRNYGGDPEGALKLYNEALKIRPDDTLILNNLADIYYSIGEYKKAEESYLTIIKSNPKWVSAYRELVNIYQYKLKDKYSLTPALLLQGLEANPEASENFYAMLAVYYEDTGDMEKAIDYYNKLLDINPDNIGANSELQKLRGIKF